MFKGLLLFAALLCAACTSAPKVDPDDGSIVTQDAFSEVVKKTRGLPYLPPNDKPLGKKVSEKAFAGFTREQLEAYFKGSKGQCTVHLQDERKLNCEVDRWWKLRSRTLGEEEVNQCEAGMRMQYQFAFPHRAEQASVWSAMDFDVLNFWYCHDKARKKRLSAVRA